MLFVEELCPLDRGEVSWKVGSEDSNRNYYLACGTCGRRLTSLSRGLTLNEIRLGLTHELHPDDWALLRSRCRSRLDEDHTSALEVEVAVCDFSEALRNLVEQDSAHRTVGGWTVSSYDGQPALA